jgi:cytochrome c oxidase cbb3-type subunit III
MDKSTYFSNPLFLTLLITVIVLLAILAVLGSVFRNISQSDLFTKSSDTKTNSGTKTLGLLLVFMLTSLSAFSQTSSKYPSNFVGGIDPLTFYTFIAIIIVELSLIYILISIIKKLLAGETESKTKTAPVPVKKERTIIDKLNASVDIEKEEDIMFDHDYDGIKELDNNLPPWWKYGFYLTIIVAVIYLFNYHVMNTGDLQEAEYKKEVKQAELAKAEYMKNAANNVDESSVKMLDNPADIEAGKQIFEGTCATCHLKLGEGSVGPNLTDDYWLHGGSIQDIFKTIKYGYPDKGMKSWKDDYSPIQIAQLASFIKTLHGTNPPNAKAPQGELYNGKETASDSLKIIMPTDSLKKDSSITEKK